MPFCQITGALDRYARARKLCYAGADFRGDSDEQADLVHSSAGAIFDAFSCRFRPSADREQTHSISPQTRDSLRQGEESMKRARLRSGFVCTMLLCCCLGGRAQGAAKNAITFDDLIRMHRISEAQVSPDGKWVAYTVATPDMQANRNASNLWTVR